MGSHEETNRNQNAQYDVRKKELQVRLPRFMEEEYGAYVHLSVEFPSKALELEDAILNPRAMWCPKRRK